MRNPLRGFRFAFSYGAIACADLYFTIMSFEEANKKNHYMKTKLFMRLRIFGEVVKSFFV
jgi:hypothetical protein